MFDIDFLLLFLMMGLTGPPSQPTNITFSAFVISLSFKIEWDIPNDTFNCVSFYLINTTSSKELLNTTDTSVLITRSEDNPANTTYTIKIAGVDMFNRIGQWSDPLCFLFQGLAENFMVPFHIDNHALYVSPQFGHFQYLLS